MQIEVRTARGGKHPYKRRESLGELRSPSSWRRRNIVGLALVLEVVQSVDVDLS